MIITLGTTPAVQKTLRFKQLVLDDVNRTADVATYASGKSINAARVLHTLGRPVLTMGFAGGSSGDLLRNDLTQAGIAHDFVAVAPATRTCTTVIDSAQRTATELIEEASPVDAPAYEQLLQRLNQHLPKARCVLLSGSLPPHAPPDFYARCISACRRAGAITILDATGAPLRSALAERPTVVKPNRRELSETVGFAITSEDDVLRGIRQLLGTGPQSAVVTAGSGPTLVADPQHAWRINSLAVEAVSPIGSGDSFAAGLAAALADGQPLPQAARLATACGAANALTPRAGHVNPEAVQQLLTQVQVQSLP